MKLFTKEQQKLYGNVKIFYICKEKPLLFYRIPKGHLELYQIAPKNLIIDIWKGPNAFELADVSCYKRVPSSLIWNLTAANVLEIYFR